jgi:hypothetical protein
MTDKIDIITEAVQELQDSLAQDEVKGLVVEQSTMMEEMVNRATELSSAIDQQKLQTLWAKTPDHAIKFRPGPGGRSMAYVPHGYVEHKLNETFGGDWDFEPLPVFNGSVFHLQQTVLQPKGGKETVVYYVAVMCKLTVRVRKSGTLDVVTTVTKTEPGSSQWHQENEFGDALKAACSDSLKRCGLRLGIALDLYYDDDREKGLKVEQAEAAHKMAEAMKVEKAKRESMAPADVPGIILRVKEKYGVLLKELVTLLYGNDANIATGMTRMTNDLKTIGPEAFWGTIEKACSPSNTIIDQENT